MELTGTAGRALGRRIGAVRDRRDRAASNDNRPVELARAEGGNIATALAERAGAKPAAHADYSRRQLE